MANEQKVILVCAVMSIAIPVIGILFVVIDKLRAIYLSANPDPQKVSSFRADSMSDFLDLSLVLPFVIPQIVLGIWAIQKLRESKET